MVSIDQYVLLFSHQPLPFFADYLVGHYAERDGELDWNALGSTMTKYLEDDVIDYCVQISEIFS